MKKVITVLRVTVAFALAGTFLAACKKKTDSAPEKEISYLQVVHASPKVTELLVSINQKKAQYKVQYLSASRLYTALPAGKDLPVQLTLGTSMVAENKVTLEKATNYSLFIYDTLRNNKVKFVVLKDELTNPGTVKTNIRFLHLSPNTPPVDIDIFKGRDSLRLEKANVFIGDNPNAAALSTFKSVAAGDYRVKIKIQVGNKPVTILDIPKLQLEGQRTATLFLRGLINGTAGNAIGLQLLQHK